MSDAPREQMLHALWPQGRQSRLGVWAVLDCARDPKIYLALLESRLEFRCLYSGRLPRELEMVAPQLVELLPGHRLVDALLRDGWGRSWGSLLRIEDPSNLRHHLRQFLKVRDEDGRRLLFRYFDPRVLRCYLPTCTPDELRTFFGPISHWIAEGVDGRSLIEFSVEAGLLRRDQRVLGGAVGAALAD